MKLQVEVYHLGLPYFSFEILQEKNLKDQLILLENAMCLFSIRKDNVITISVIISNEKGKGKLILEKLKSLNPNSIIAKCPIDLEANSWYSHNEFLLVGTQTTKSGRILNIWKMEL